MDYQQLQSVLQCVSNLLNYPDEAYPEIIDQSQELVDFWDDPLMANRMRDFILVWQTMEFSEFVQNYVDTFDFSKNTNLYLTYSLAGEQKERGSELLELKQYYEKAGLAPTDHELPDYLPLLLEFAANVPIEDGSRVLKKYRKNIEGIREQLIQRQSYYVILFDVLLMAVEELEFCSG